MTSLKKHLQERWIKIRKMVIEEKYLEAAAAANESCDPHEFGPCSECPAIDANICGFGKKKLLLKFRTACIRERQGEAKEYAETIIDWTKEE